MLKKIQYKSKLKFTKLVIDAIRQITNLEWQEKS